jgi:hypothetical protein
MNTVEARSAVSIVANNFVRMVRVVSDHSSRLKLRRLFQSCIEFLYIWIQQEAAVRAPPSSGEIFAVVKCQLLQLGVSNTFVALLDPYMPCTQLQDSTISEHFDCWEIMHANCSASPLGSPTAASRKRSSSDCSLCELSPICNRQLLKQCRMDGDR